MKEIRICWTPDVDHALTGVFRDGGFWFGDFDEPRRALNFIIRTENAEHGAGTHWIEEREVGDDPPARCACPSSRLSEANGHKSSWPRTPGLPDGQLIGPRSY